jgi:hypothetical protein
MSRRIVWSVLALAVLLLPAVSKADTITVNWGEQNGPDGAALPFTLNAGTMVFTIPAGQQILNAVFSSTLGNTLVGSTAVMNVFVNGIQVGSCPSGSSPCFLGGPNPFTYTFTSGDLNSLLSGTADLTITQLD